MKHLGRVDRPQFFFAERIELGYVVLRCGESIDPGRAAVDGSYQILQLFALQLRPERRISDKRV